MTTQPQAPGIAARIARRLWRAARRWRFRASLRHLHGPGRLDTPEGATIVVTLIRDGAYYLDAFFDHYRAMGVRHFVFADTGSRDGSIERIAAEPGTVILRARLPIEYESEFRRHAAERFCQDRWCLFADCDELFDFEGRAAVGIDGLTRYMGENGFDGLVAQMLDLFPRGPLRGIDGMDYAEAIAACRYYDLSRVERVAYHDAEAIEFSWYLRDNVLANPEIPFLFGGVRRRVFGEDCALTKHPLVFVGGAVAPGVHPHCASNLRVADVTALIRHYKFTDDLMGRDARSVRAGQVPHGEDRRRLAVYEADPDLSLYGAQAQEFTGIGPLYRAGFLTASPRYSAWLARQGEARDG